MNDFVTQIVCGTRWLDIEDSGWAQILVFIIIAVIYALGSIVKAKRGKTEGQEESAFGGLRKTRQRAPTAEGVSKQRIMEGQPRVAPALGGPRPQHQVTARPTAGWTEVVGQILEAVTGQARPVPARSPAVPGVQVSPPSVAQAELKAQPSQVTVSEPEDKHAPVPALAQVSMPENLYEILADYADPEKVWKVILHYEILGKPLSLRQPPDSIIVP
jgi:hypothetical protein